jgi:outer membrane protein assembly factor BamB
MWPHEDIVMVSLSQITGNRRWAIENTTGAPPGGTSPMVLHDPENDDQDIIYQTLYDRAIAVRPDGTIVWDVSTGLTLHGDFNDAVMGNNYLPAHDAIVGVAADGAMYALDRATGESLLDVPYNLPGAPSPPSTPPSNDVVFIGTIVMGQYINFPKGDTYLDFVNLIKGSENVVANQIAVNPHTSRIFIATTAPDEEDGVADSVSELGAIYGIDLVKNGDRYTFVEACYRPFDGATTSTPSMVTDGSRLYVSDRRDLLIALNNDCTDAWTLEMGDLITGSMSISSDNNEIYVGSPTGLFKVIDEGTYGRVEWQANIDVFDIPQEWVDKGYSDFNMNLVSIGANALFFQAAAGFHNTLPFNIGMGQLDRATGEVRWFAEGREEVGVMTTGPDGSLYGGHTPIRRFKAMYKSKKYPDEFPPTQNLTGGIRKWTAERLDLLFDEAICAAADRLANAIILEDFCPDSVDADVRQVKILIEQAKTAGITAVSREEMPISVWRDINPLLITAEIALDNENIATATEALEIACESQR